MTDTIVVPKGDLQALFDTALGSMDFGSGFLDDSEVECLRRVAVVLGVNPNLATPFNFQDKYPHPFDGRPSRVYDEVLEPWTGTRSFHEGVVCKNCGKEKEKGNHS